MKGIGDRVHAARKSLGLTKSEVATHLGVTIPWVYDLEAYDDDLPSTLSLRQVLRLADVLDVPARLLVCGADSPKGVGVNTEDVASVVRSRLRVLSMDVDQFGEHVGWDISSFTRDPGTMWDDWCLDCLKDVCDAVQIDWRMVLPENVATA